MQRNEYHVSYVTKGGGVGDRYVTLDGKIDSRKVLERVAAQIKKDMEFDSDVSIINFTWLRTLEEGDE